MKIETFVIGMIGTNCYLVSNEETKECFLVDAAGESPELTAHIRQSGLSLKAILLTHGHFDHITGLDSLTKEFDVPVYAHEKEEILLNDASYNASASYGMPFTWKKAEYVRDGQTLEIAGTEIRVLHTPGHTTGGCCYYIEKEQALFSGDTLFCASVGRTDLPTGSESRLLRSISEKLMPLPDETKVYPGHMEETTIGYERNYNPYLL